VTQKVYLNPILDHFNAVFKTLGAVTLVKANGESVTVANAEELEKAFVGEKVTLDELRTNLSAHLIKLIAPVRESLKPVLALNKAAPEMVLDGNLIALKKGQDNGNTTDPDNVIFLTDSDDDIKRKITKAFVPPKMYYEVKKAINPCMDYFKHLIFDSFPKVKIARSLEYGGDVEYDNYASFEKDFVEGKLDPKDVKVNLVGYIDQLVKPVRDHFTNDANAKDLLEKVKKYRVTK